MPPPRFDVVRASSDVLDDGEPRAVSDICLMLRAHGWSIEPEHLRAILARDPAFLAMGQRFALRPGAPTPEPTGWRTWDDVSDELLVHLEDHRWSELVVRAAFPPPLEPQHTELGRRMEAERRSRSYHLAKVFDRYCWLVAWTCDVTLTRRDALRSWACWPVTDLASWTPDGDPVQLRYRGLPPSEVVLTKAAAGSAPMVEMLVAELRRSGAAAGHVWVELVPLGADGLRERERALVDVASAELAVANGPPAAPARTRRSRAKGCRVCDDRLSADEDVERGAHQACWAATEPAESAALRFTRAEWVGALDRSGWAALVHTGAAGHAHSEACRHLVAVP